MGRNPITKHGRDHRPPKWNGPNDPGGHDPIPGIPSGLAGGPGLNDTIVSLRPDAWWKLDETSGTVAKDSSGNGWDLQVAATGGYVAPTWGQAALPPGTTSALFTAGSSTSAPGAQVARGVLPAFPALSGDFTAVIWAERQVWGAGGVVPEKLLMGQGDPTTTHHAGWALGIEASNVGAHNHLELLIGDTSAGPHALESDSALTDGTAYVVGVTRISGVFRLYVNGLLQSTTSSAAYSSTSGFWIGTDPNSGLRFEQNSALMSYAMVWGSRGLSGAEMLSLPTIAATGGLPGSGTVPVAGGDGTVTYEAITESLITLSDVTTDNATTSKHGFVPKGDGNGAHFLDGTMNWSTPGGVGGGNFTLISDILLGADTASFSFASIAGYKHLKLVTSLRTDRAATEDLLLVQFNADTTAGHYYTQRELCSGTSIQGAEFLGSFAGYSMVICGASAAASMFGTAEMNINDYLGTTALKSCIGNGFAPSGLTTGLLDSARFGMLWNSTAAITAMVLKPGVGTVFKAGSRATLYGLS